MLLSHKGRQLRREDDDERQIFDTDIEGGDTLIVLNSPNSFLRWADQRHVRADMRACARPALPQKKCLLRVHSSWLRAVANPFCSTISCCSLLLLLLLSLLLLRLLLHAFTPRTQQPTCRNAPEKPGVLAATQLQGRAPTGTNDVVALLRCVASSESLCFRNQPAIIIYLVDVRFLPLCPLLRVGANLQLARNLT